MLEYEDYTSSDKPERKAFDFPRVLKDMNICYDGGRLHIYINNQEVYTNMLASNDFSITLNSEELPDEGTED